GHAFIINQTQPATRQPLDSLKSGMMGVKHSVWYCLFFLCALPCCILFIYLFSFPVFCLIIGICVTS
uniref:Uncharacterized protein n=1 Tax=Denticeps clupeoides TaxID=299321 RepID=A0AAY4E568_9TELE